jgi:hypothetical protein
MVGTLLEELAVSVFRVELNALTMEVAGSYEKFYSLRESSNPIN